LAGRDPIGKRYSRSSRPPEWVEVAGVVAKVRIHGSSVPLPETYVRLGMPPNCSPRCVVLRTASDPGRSASALRAGLRAVDRDLPLSQVMMMNEVIDQQSSSRRLRASRRSQTEQIRRTMPGLDCRRTWGSVLGMVLGRAMVLVGAGFAVAWQVRSRCGRTRWSCCAMNA
jgi:hypothetical protein